MRSLDTIPVSILTVTDGHPLRTRFHTDLALSLAAQQEVDIEWVVSVANTDRGLAALANITSLVEDCPHVSVVPVLADIEALGVGDRREDCLYSASNPYALALNDDDALAHPLSLRALAEQLEDPDVVAAIGPTIEIPVTGEPVEWSLRVSPGVHRSSDDFIRQVSLPSLSFHPSSVMSKTSFLKGVGAWSSPEQVCRDIATTLDLLGRSKANLVAVVTVPVLQYRRHAQGVTATAQYRLRKREVLHNIYAEHGLIPG